MPDFTVNFTSAKCAFSLIANFYAHTEKEEQKRFEWLAKERLKALKADDEEAYMKLIYSAKDTRITHLFRQTDAFLDSLAQAVLRRRTRVDLCMRWASNKRKAQPTKLLLAV